MTRTQLWFGLTLALSGCRQVAGIDDLGKLDKQRRLEELPCSTNKECRERFDDSFFCRHADHLCAPLFSEECDQASGDILNDHALILGSTEPNSGVNEATGRSLRTALQLAVEDFADGSRGLPPLPGTSARRPLAILHCDDQGQRDRAENAVKHLSRVARVPAIVGATYSGVTLDVSLVTVSDGTLLISPSATSAAISSINDNDLVWRTAPSDNLQASAQVALVKRVARELRPTGTAGAPPIKLTVVHKGDAYGRGLTDSVLKELTLNGSNALSVENRPYVRQHDYGDPNATPPTTRYEEAVRRTLEELPEIILVYGTSEAAVQVLGQLEKDWPTNAARPRYVLADGGRSDELREVIAQLDPTGTVTRLANRIIGTEPGTLSTEQGSFSRRYQDRSQFPDEPVAFGAANAYDAVYLLAFAAARSGVEAPNGYQMSKALKDFLPLPGDPGQELSVGTKDINAAFRLLSSGERLALRGASGMMSFDLATGDVLSDIVMWCPQLDDGNVSLATNGEIFRTSSEGITVGASEVVPCGNGR